MGDDADGTKRRLSLRIAGVLWLDMRIGDVQEMWCRLFHDTPPANASRFVRVYEPQARILSSEPGCYLLEGGGYVMLYFLSL